MKAYLSKVNTKSTRTSSWRNQVVLSNSQTQNKAAGLDVFKNKNKTVHFKLIHFQFSYFLVHINRGCGSPFQLVYLNITQDAIDALYIQKGYTGSYLLRIYVSHWVAKLVCFGTSKETPQSATFCVHSFTLLLF